MGLAGGPSPAGMGADPDGPGPDEAPGSAPEGAAVLRLPLAADETREVAEAPAPPASVGAELRQAREAAGLTLSEIAQRTKVRPGILSHIEADAHDELPALTYTLGFLKAYARTVGLDPEAVAARYRRESQKGDPVPGFVDLQPLEERRLPSRGLLVASLAGGLILLIGLLAWGLWPSPVAPLDETAAPPAAAPAVVPAPPAAGGASGPAAPAAGGPVRLTATDDVWIRVRDAASGERLFEGVLAKGQVFDVPPARALVLRAGRAGALSVSIGGEVLPPLGGPAEVLAAQPLDPAALRARSAPRGGLADGPTAAPGAAPAPGLSDTPQR